MTSKSIILCEPQCWGFEHAQFNAALLETVLLAYPDTQMIFMGEAEHLDWVRAILEQYDAPAAQRVVWHPLSIPPKRLDRWRRLKKEWNWCRLVVRQAAAREARCLVLCSMTAEGLFTLKLWLYVMRTSMSVIVVLHSVLSTILERQPRRPWHWALSLRQVLRLPHPDGLHYIALGESIYQHLRASMPKVARYFRSLDPPYFWPVREQEIATVHCSPKRVRFGFLGVANKGKGFEIFACWAAEVKAQSVNTEFAMVGFLGDLDGDLADYDAVEDVAREPLSPEVYAQRASSLTYTVWLAEPLHYRLVASATFLDALAYVKPGIYLRNPYIEYYFERMGDIGYLCDTYEDMRVLIVSLARDFPVERYRQQCENILRGRVIFEPQALTLRLRNIVEK